MTALPGGWRRASLGETLNLKYGKALAAALRDPDGPVPVVGSAGRMTGTHVALVDGPAVLIGRKGNVGQVQFLSSGCWPIDTTYYSAIPATFEARFLTYQLVALELKKLDSSTTTPSLRRQDLEAQPLVVPPIEEQQRIVEVLEDHLSRLDAAASYVRAAMTRAGNLRWGAANAAIEQVGGNPVLLGDVAQIRNGIFVSRPGTEPKGIPILRIGAVRPLSLDLSDLRYSERSEVDLREADGLLERGDVLFTRYNGNPRFVGACALVPEDALPLTYPDKLIRVRVTNDGVLPAFVALACSVGQGRKQIQASVRTTAGQAGISGRDLKSVAIRIPDPTLQATAVGRASDAAEATGRLLAELTQAQLRITQLRHSVLADAFSGRLTPSGSGGAVA